MTTTPPPLPPTHIEDEDRNSFSRQASKASLVAPLLIVILSYCCQALLANHEYANGHILLAVVELASVVLMVVGLILGLLALILMQPGGRGPIILRASAGIVMSSLLLAIFIPNFLRAREKAIAQRKAYAEVHSPSQDLQKGMVVAAREGKPMDITRLQKSMEDAGKIGTGQDAAIMKASSAYLQKLQVLQQAYVAATEDLTNSHILQASDLTQREQLQARKAVVQKFLAANEAVKSFLESNAENYRQELLDQKVSPAGISKALLGFHKTADPQAPLIREVRETDSRMGRAMVGVLDLLDTDWGRWRYNNTSQRLNFNSTSSLEKYNDYLRELDSAREDQAVAQEKLVSLVSRRVR